MIKTFKHLAYFLSIRRPELLKILRNIDRYYYTEEEIKIDANGNPRIKHGIVQKRILHPSKSTLKLAQKRINSRIFSKMKFPDYAFGGMRKRDNISNALMHLPNKYKFSTDIRNFFPSIGNDKVFAMFVANDFSPTVAHVLTKLVTYKGSLPQGAPTSPYVANLVFAQTGGKLEQIISGKRMVLTSFIDDVTISSKIDFKEEVPRILRTIKDDGYKISHDKTYYKQKTVWLPA